MAAGVAAAWVAAVPPAGASGGAEALFATDLPPNRVVEQVVTAVMLEPDPALALLLVKAAARALPDQPEHLTELLGAVLLVLPEEAALRLAPAVVASLAAADDDLRLLLAGAAAVVLGRETGDILAAAGRFAVADGAVGVSAASTAAVSRPGTVEVEALPWPVIDRWLRDPANTDLWLMALRDLLPFFSAEDVAVLAEAFGMTAEQLVTLLVGVPPEVVVEPVPIDIPVPIPMPPDPDETASPW